MSSTVQMGVVAQLFVDASGDAALDATDRFSFRLSFALSSGDVVLGALLMADSDDRDPVERGVGLAVAALAEPVADLISGGAAPGLMETLMCPSLTVLAWAQLGNKNRETRCDWVLLDVTDGRVSPCQRHGTV